MRIAILAKAAQVFLVLLFTATVLFHTAALLRFVPYEILWGGRLQSVEEMYVFEAVSLLLNALFLAVALLKIRFLNSNLADKWLNMALWAICLIAILGTVGNVFSQNPLERAIFTPVTALMALAAALATFKNRNK